MIPLACSRCGATVQITERLASEAPSPRCVACLAPLVPASRGAAGAGGPAPAQGVSPTTAPATSPPAQSLSPALLSGLSYTDFLAGRAQRGRTGFCATFMPAALFDFQRSLVEWAVGHGRAAIFADCGLGKTPMQLAWAENVARETGKPVLVLTPLAVAAQTLREAEKFGIDCRRSNGEAEGRIVVANYERLHRFDAASFAGVVCDESSILKSFDGARRTEITTFMRRTPYRLLCTATAAPNDYLELGTSSEALGHLGHVDMLGRFFVNDSQNCASRRMYGEAPKWRFKGHGRTPFWCWVTSWARACRKPSDLGFSDERFVLPPIREAEHLVVARTRKPGTLFDLPSSTLPDQREERRRTMTERCERAAGLVAETGRPAVIWCHLNDEGDLLEELVAGSVQVSGRDSDDEKEEKFGAFASGSARVLVTKPKIGAWGLNWQHCSHVVFFPSHSYEQYYQAVRRCWRFGQTRPVQVDLVLTEGERLVMQNLQRKAVAADEMFMALVAEMNHSMQVTAARESVTPEVPAWLR